jgi:hypothetical protein
MWKSRNRFQKLIATGVLLGIAMASGETLWAQQGKVVYNSLPSSETMGSCLPHLRWDNAKRGPLLIVDPAHAYPPYLPGGRMPPPLAADHSERRLTIQDIAEHFRYKEFSVGSLTALAPSRMVTLTPNPAPPRLDVVRDRPDALLQLVASLDRSQWTLAGGPHGIGSADLNSRQRKLYLAALPKPFQIRRKEVQAAGADDQPTLLPDSRRSSVRLRFSRSLTIVVPYSDGKGGLTLKSLNPSTLEETRPAYCLVPSSPPAYLPAKEPDGTLLGVTVRKRVPNRPKPGHLDFNSATLSPFLRLGGATTVQSLIERAAKETGLDLRADRRVATLPVWISDADATARAGDVLKALALSVTGTFRKIGSVYLLTWDTEGIAPRMARIRRWADKADRAHYEWENDLSNTPAHKGAGKCIGIDPEQGIVETDSLFDALAHVAMRRPCQAPPPRLPLSVLHPTNQAAIRALVKERSPVPLDPREIYIAEEITAAYLVPGYGTIPAEDIDDHLLACLYFASRPLPPGTLLVEPVQETKSWEPIKLPPAVKTHTLIVSGAALASEESVKHLMQTAARRGFTMVWVAMGPEDKVPVLRRAVVAGKREGIQVGAMPLVIPASKGRFLGRDEFAAPEWPSIPETWTALLRRLSALAAVPGLSAFALVDTAQLARGLSPDRNPAPRLPDASGPEVYPLEWRLSFLKQHGIDPIDLTGWEPDTQLERDKVSLLLPFFTEDRFRKPLTNQGNFGIWYIADGEALYTRDRGQEFDVTSEHFAEIWKQRIRQEENALLSSLLENLREQHTELPLYVPGEMPRYRDKWLVQWEKGDTIPLEAVQNWQPGTKTKPSPRSVFWRYHVPSSFELSAFPERVSPDAGLFYFPYRVEMQFRGDKFYKEWDGSVLDLSAQPPKNLLPLLEKLIAPK